MLASHSIEARTYFSPACHQQKQFQSSPFRSSGDGTDCRPDCQSAALGGNE
ncbi:hypothetical protein P7H15_01715 [Paenibacillus larvae]|nr:hypothetical protein [Paenibacillus larvae]MDT2291889.1 hypothetical protein [Paenibacillus larvae]